MYISVYITKVVSHEIFGQSSVSSSHIATFSLCELDVFMTHTKTNRNAACYWRIRKCSVHYIQYQMFYYAATPTLSHTLFSHAPCVTPHPMTDRLPGCQSRRSQPRIARFYSRACNRQHACLVSCMLVVSMVLLDRSY